MALAQGPNQRGQRRHRYRPGTAALRSGMELGNEPIQRLLRPPVHNQRLMDMIVAPQNVAPEQVPAVRNDLVPRMEDPEEGFILNPAMEARVVAELDQAKTQSDRNFRLFGEKVYAVYKQEGLIVTVETISRFLSDLANEESFFYWNGRNTTVIVRFFEYLFKRIHGLRLAWNEEFHKAIAYLDSTEMEYLSRFYVAGLKKKIIIPHAGLWSNVVGDWSASLRTFFISLFQKLHSTFPEPVLAKKLKEWDIVEMITNGPQIVENLTLAMERVPVGDAVINMIKRLCHEMLVDMTSRVLKDDPDYLENLIISKAKNLGYDNKELVKLIWAGILKRVMASRVKENRIRVFNIIPRILSSREQLRGYVQFAKLEFFSAMHFPEEVSFLVEEMDSFIGNCLHYGIIKLVDINSWKITSTDPQFNEENPCHQFLLEMDLKGM